MQVDWKYAQPLIAYTVQIGEPDWLGNRETETIVLEWPEVMICAYSVITGSELIKKEHGGYRITADNAEAFYLVYETRGFPNAGELLLGKVYSNVEPRPDVEAAKGQSG